MEFISRAFVSPQMSPQESILGAPAEQSVHSAMARHDSFPNGHHGASDAQPFRSSVSPAGTFDPNSQVHQGGHIGLEVTMEPPHAVVAVQDLVDHNFIKQGVAGYSNEPVLPGDRILEVDGTPAEHVTVEDLRGMLKGGLYTVCELILARPEPDNRRRLFSVRVLRHRYHEFDVMDGVNTPVPTQAVPPMIVQHAQRPAAQRSAPLPMQSHRPMRSDDMVDGECTRIMEGHTDMLYDCVWSHADGGGRWILSCSADQTLRLWDVSTGSCYRVLEGHSAAVWTCSLSPRDGGRRWALSGSRDKTARIFDIESGDCVSVLQGHTGSIYSCEWSVSTSEGAFALTGSADKTVRVWDAMTGACTQVLEGHSASVCCCAWSIADGGLRWVLSGSDDETVRLWDLEEGQNYFVLEGHNGPVLCCAWSNAAGGRKWLISGSWDKQLKVWDAMKGSIVKTLTGHSAPVYGCEWSHADGGGRWVVSGSYDELLKVWDVPSGSCVRTLIGHTRWVRCCRWSDGDGGKRWVVSGSRDKTLRLWEFAWNELTVAATAPQSDEFEVSFGEEVEVPCTDQANLFKTSVPRAAQRAAPQPMRAASPPLQSHSPGIEPVKDGEVDRLKTELAKARQEALTAKTMLNESVEEAAQLHSKLKQARAEAEGARLKLAVESQEIEMIKQEMTGAISKARAEADEQKLHLMNESKEVEKIKQRFESLEVEIKFKYEDTVVETDSMRYLAKEEADRVRSLAEEEAARLRSLAKEEADRIRSEAEADAQDLLKKTFNQIQNLKEEDMFKMNANYADIERLRHDAAEAARAMEVRKKEVERAAAAAEAAASAEEEMRTRLNDHMAVSEQMKASSKQSQRRAEEAEEQLEGSRQRIVELERHVAHQEESLKNSNLRMAVWADHLERDLMRVELNWEKIQPQALKQHALLSRSLETPPASPEKNDGISKYLNSIQYMVTKLQHGIEETDGIDGYSDARISDFSQSHHESHLESHLDDSDIIAASKDEHFDAPHAPEAPVIVKSTPSAKRSARPVSASTQLLRPEDGFIGLKVTHAPPHAVVQVDDLVDVNFVRYDAAGYSNPAVTPGDRILKVDDMFAEHVSVETLHSLLVGELNTPVKISLARVTGEEYSINVIRHRFHAFDPPAKEEEDATVFVKQGRHAVTRAAPPLTRAAPPPTSAHPPPKQVSPSNSSVSRCSAKTPEQPPEEKPRKPIPIVVLVLAVATFVCSAVFAVLLLGSEFPVHGDENLLSSPSLPAIPQLLFSPSPSYIEVSEPMAAAAAKVAAAAEVVDVATSATALEADVEEEVEEAATRGEPEETARELEPHATAVEEPASEESAMGEPEDTTVEDRASEEEDEPVIDEKAVKGEPEEMGTELEADVTEEVEEAATRGEPEETARELESLDTKEEGIRTSSGRHKSSWNLFGGDPEL